jgi:hypothetical protein
MRIVLMMSLLLVAMNPFQAFASDQSKDDEMIIKYLSLWESMEYLDDDEYEDEIYTDDQYDEIKVED